LRFEPWYTCTRMVLLTSIKIHTYCSISPPRRTALMNGPKDTISAETRSKLVLDQNAGRFLPKPTTCRGWEDYSTHHGVAPGVAFNNYKNRV
jgi:hypothetical protein